MPDDIAPVMAYLGGDSASTTGERGSGRAAQEIGSKKSAARIAHAPARVRAGTTIGPRPWLSDHDHGSRYETTMALSVREAPPPRDRQKFLSRSSPPAPARPRPENLSEGRSAHDHGRQPASRLPSLIKLQNNVITLHYRSSCVLLPVVLLGYSCPCSRVERGAGAAKTR